jgi:uncharacterized phosphosugar-binding protein
MDHLGASDQLSAPTRDYVVSAIDTLGRLLDREAANIATAAEWLADAVGSGGLIRLFATGHSSLLIQDLFYRAGGLAPVDAILEDSVTGYRDATKSEHVERLEGLAPLILDHRRLEPNDALVVFSQSGRNAVPIEVAQQARVRGLHTIAVTSLAHATGQTSRHSSGMHLHDVAELVIDTGTPLGDCAVSLPNGTLMGPLSTVVGSAVGHVLAIETAMRLHSRGEEAPVFRSGNMDGGREWNDALLDRYWGRIPGW